MKTYAGIWLDHKKAVVVTIKRPVPSHEDGEAEKITLSTLNSDVERKVRLSGGARSGKTPWGPQDVAVNGRSEARQKQQLKEFYLQVAKAVENADNILIMGPGEAKHEFKKAVEKLKSTAGKIADLQTCDKMTDRQIAASVRSFFHKN